MTYKKDVSTTIIRSDAEDNISRSYVVSELRDLADEFNEVDENGLHSERWCGVLDSIGVVENAPPAAPNRSNDWTPCCERPPKEKGKYLVTEKVYTITDNDHAGKYSVLVEEVAYDPVFYKHSGGWARTRTKYEIVAWMPMPAPWEGADGE